MCTAPWLASVLVLPPWVFAADATFTLDELPVRINVSCPFITPCLPVLRDKLPSSSDWLHEAKFDGWRRSTDAVKMFSRKGSELLPRFQSLRGSLEYLRESVVDGELVACDSDGRPDFAAIAKNHDNLASGVLTCSSTRRPSTAAMDDVSGLNE